MDFSKNNISRLLSLYEEGKTTLTEENLLKAYFKTNDYDSDFEAYALLFDYFDKESETTTELNIKPVESTSSFKHLWLNVAASILVILGGVWFYNYSFKQQNAEEARLAFEKTQNALNLISANMNKGLEQLEYVEVFAQEKNKLIK